MHLRQLPDDDNTHNSIAMTVGRPIRMTQLVAEVASEPMFDASMDLFVLIMGRRRLAPLIVWTVVNSGQKGGGA